MNFKICTKCGKELPCTLDYFYKKSFGRNGLSSECKECSKIRSKINREGKGRDRYIQRKKEYYQENKEEIYKKTREWGLQHPDKVKEYNKKYWQSPKGKKVRAEWDSKWYEENTEYELERNRKFLKTPEGMKCIRRRHAKRKNMGYIELIPNPFDDNEDVEWHHFFGAYVVALPKDLHQLYHGRNKVLHKFMCMEIINQLYL